MHALFQVLRTFGLVFKCSHGFPAITGIPCRCPPMCAVFLWSVWNPRAWILLVCIELIKVAHLWCIELFSNYVFCRCLFRTLLSASNVSLPVGIISLSEANVRFASTSKLSRPANIFRLWQAMLCFWQTRDEEGICLVLPGILTFGGIDVHH